MFWGGNGGGGGRGVEMRGLGRGRRWCMDEDERGGGVLVLKKIFHFSYVP